MKTTQLRSLGSLRAAAESHRRGFLRGSGWLPVQDRDLDRIAADLLAISQAEGALTPSAKPAHGSHLSPVRLAHRPAA